MDNNRIAFYTFFSKDGNVQDYVLFYLTSLQNVAKDIYVIVNGSLSPLGQKRLESINVNIFTRENYGLDFGAWKYAIDLLGLPKLRLYDEVVFCNCSCFGPIYPFEEMFSTMKARECSFWGVTKHPELDQLFNPSDPNSKIIEHIQSYFIVFKKNLVNDQCFDDFWKNIKISSNWMDEIVEHEIKFTNYFESRGFVSSTYVNFDKYRHYCNDSSILEADELLINERNPLLKKKVFTTSLLHYLSFSTGKVSRIVLDYVAQNTSYNVDYIWDEILKNNRMSDLQQSLHLNYILPTTHCIEHVSSSTVAIVYFVYYDELVDECVHYIKSMPQGSKVIIISAKEDLLDRYKKAIPSDYYDLELRKMTVNRGRDIAGYLIEAKDVYDSYDYICCMHDKMSKQTGSMLISKEFSYHNTENNLASPDFVKNIIHTFDTNKRLGMLVPPTVDFSVYFGCLGHEIGVNRDNILKVMSMLKLSIPFDEIPVAPFGSMFWVRGKAFKSMFNHDWKHSDLPGEPLPPDGSISHAIERVYPLAVQNTGYAVGWLSTQEYASLYFNSNTFMLRILSSYIFGMNGVAGKIPGEITFAKLFSRLNNVMFLGFDKSENGLDFDLFTFMKKTLKKHIKSDLLKVRIKAFLSFGKRKQRYLERKKDLKKLRNFLNNQML